MKVVIEVCILVALVSGLVAVMGPAIAIATILMAAGVAAIFTGEPAGGVTCLLVGACIVWLMAM